MCWGMENLHVFIFCENGYLDNVLFMVFLFTGAHTSDILAKAVQTLIDTPRTAFHCFQICLQ